MAEFKCSKCSKCFNPHEHDEIEVVAEVDLEASNKLFRQALEESRAEVEQLRVQLAGCSTAAMGYVRDSRPEQACHRGQYGWSVALEDIKTLYESYDRRSTALRELYRLENQDTYINETSRRPTAEEWSMAWQRAGEALGQTGVASSEVIDKPAL